MAAVSNPQGRSSFIFSTSPTLCGQVIATSLFNVGVNYWKIFWWSYMTPCSKYHMVFLIKSSKRIRNFVDVTNMHTLFKQLDDEMVTFISFCSQILSKPYLCWPWAFGPLCFKVYGKQSGPKIWPRLAKMCKPKLKHFCITSTMFKLIFHMKKNRKNLRKKPFFYQQISSRSCSIYNLALRQGDMLIQECRR